MASKNGIIIDVGFNSQGGINDLVNDIEQQLKSVDFDGMVGLSKAFDDQAKDVREKLSKLKDEINKVIDGKVTGTTEDQLKVLNKSVKVLTDNFKNLLAAMPGNNDNAIKQLDGISSEIQEVSGMCQNAVDTVGELKAATKGKITIISSDQKKELEDIFNLIERTTQAAEKMDQPKNKRGHTPYKDEEEALVDLANTFKVFSEQQKKFDEVFNNNSLDTKDKTKQLDNLAITLTNTATSFSRLIATISKFTDDWGNLEPFDNGKTLFDFQEWMAPQIDKYLNYLSKRKIEIQNAYSEMGGGDLLDKYTKSKTKDQILIKVGLDSNARTKLVQEVSQMLAKVQEDLDETPLQIEVQLMSGYQSKKNKAVLSQIKEELSKVNLDDKAITDKVQNLLDRMNRYTENAMLFTVDVQTDEAIRKVKEYITKTKESLEENPLELDISFNEEKTDLEKIKKKLDKIQEKIDEVSLAFVDQSATMKYSIDDEHEYLSKLYNDLVSIRTQIISTSDLMKTLNQTIAVDIDFTGFTQQDGEFYQEDVMDAIKVLSSAINSIESSLKNSIGDFFEIPEANKAKFLNDVNELAAAVKKIFDTSDISSWTDEAINAFKQVGVKLQKQVGRNSLSDNIADFVDNITLNANAKDRRRKYYQDLIRKNPNVRIPAEEFAQSIPREVGFIIDDKGKAYGGAEDQPDSNGMTPFIIKEYKSKNPNGKVLVRGHSHGEDYLVSSSTSQYIGGDPIPHGSDTASGYGSWKEGVEYGLTVARKQIELIDYKKLYGENPSIDFGSYNIIKLIADTKKEALKENRKSGNIGGIKYLDDFLNTYGEGDSSVIKDMLNNAYHAGGLYDYSDNNYTKRQKLKFSNLLRDVDEDTILNKLSEHLGEGDSPTTAMRKSIKDAMAKKYTNSKNVADLIGLDYSKENDPSDYVNEVLSSYINTIIKSNGFDTKSNLIKIFKGDVVNKYFTENNDRELILHQFDKMGLANEVLNRALTPLGYKKDSWNNATKKYTHEEFREQNPLGLSEEALDSVDQPAQSVSVDLSEVSEKLDKIITQLQEISSKTFEINIDQSSINELIEALKSLPNYLSEASGTANNSGSKLNDLMARKAELEKKLVDLKKKEKDLEDAEASKSNTKTQPTTPSKKTQPKKSNTKEETKTQSNNLVKLTNAQIKLAEQITQNNMHSVSKLNIQDKFGVSPNGKNVKALMAAGIIGESPSNSNILESKANSLDKLNNLLANVIAKEVADTKSSSVTKSQITGIAKLINAGKEGLTDKSLLYGSKMNNLSNPLYDALKKAGLISIETTTKDVYNPQDQTTSKKEVNIIRTSLTSMGELVKFLNQNISLFEKKVTKTNTMVDNESSSIPKKSKKTSSNNDESDVIDFPTKKNDKAATHVYIEDPVSKFKNIKSQDKYKFTAVKNNYSVDDISYLIEQAAFDDTTLSELKAAVPNLFGSLEKSIGVLFNALPSMFNDAEKRITSINKLLELNSSDLDVLDGFDDLMYETSMASNEDEIKKVISDSNLPEDVRKILSNHISSFNDIYMDSLEVLLRKTNSNLYEVFFGESGSSDVIKFPKDKVNKSLLGLSNNSSQTKETDDLFSQLSNIREILKKDESEPWDAATQIFNIADKYGVAWERINVTAESTDAELEQLAKAISDGSIVPNKDNVTEFSLNVIRLKETLEKIYSNSNVLEEKYLNLFDQLRSGEIDFNGALETIIENEEWDLNKKRYESNFKVKPLWMNKTFDLNDEEYVKINRPSDEEVAKQFEERAKNVLKAFAMNKKAKDFKIVDESKTDVFSDVSSFDDAVKSIFDKIKSNIRSYGDTPEYGFAGDIFDANSITKIIQGEIAGINTNQINDAIKEAGNEFVSNFAAHSHGEEIFAFSPDDIERAAEQLQNGIIYQLGIGLGESAIFNAGEFTPEQLNEIADIMRKNAFYSYEELMEDPLYQDNNGQVLAKNYAGKIVKDEDALMDMFSSNFSKGMSYIFTKLSLTYDEGFEYIKDNIDDFSKLNNSEEGLNKLRNIFSEFSNIDKVLDSFVKYANQSYINDAFVNAIKQVSPNTDVDKVFKKTVPQGLSYIASSVAHKTSTKSKKKDDDVENNTVNVDINPVVSKAEFIKNIISQLAGTSIPIDVTPTVNTAAKSNENTGNLPNVLMKDFEGNVIKWYRTVNDSLTGLFSSSDRGSFATSNLATSLTYRDKDDKNIYKTYEEEIKLTDKILEIQGKGKRWYQLSFLGAGYDEDSKEINRLVKQLDKFDKLKKDISERFNYSEGFLPGGDKEFTEHYALKLYGMYSSDNEFKNFSNDDLNIAFNEISKIEDYLNSEEGMAGVLSSDEIKDALNLKYFSDVDLDNVYTSNFKERENLLLYEMYQRKMLSKDNFTVARDEYGFPDEDFDPSTTFPEMEGILKYIETFINNDENTQKIIKETFDAAKRITEINSDSNNLYGYSIPTNKEYSIVSGKKSVETNDFVRKASAKGMDAVLFRNIVDTANYDTPEPADIISVINNSIINSVRELSNDEILNSQDKMKMLKVFSTKEGNSNIEEIIKKRISDTLLKNIDVSDKSKNKFDQGVNAIKNDDFNDIYQSIADYIRTYLSDVKSSLSYEEIGNSLKDNVGLQGYIFNGFFSRMSYFENNRTNKESSKKFYDEINSNLPDFINSIIQDIASEAEKSISNNDQVSDSTTSSTELTLEQQVSEIKTLVEGILNYLQHGDVDSATKNDIVNSVSSQLGGIIEKSEEAFGEGNIVTEELSPLFKALIEQQRDDNLMVSQGKSIKERSMVADKNGNIFGQYTYDEETSNDLSEALIEGAREAGIDASVAIHSHSNDNYATSSPSFYNYIEDEDGNKKKELLGGDISAFYTDLQNGIKTQITSGLKDFEIFDAEGFYNYGNNKNITWDSSSVQNKIAKSSDNFDDDFNDNFLNYVSDYLNSEYATNEDIINVIDAVSEYFRQETTTDKYQREFNTLFDKIDQEDLYNAIKSKDSDMFKQIIVESMRDMGGSESMLQMMQDSDFSFDGVKKSDLNSNLLTKYTKDNIYEISLRKNLDKIFQEAGIGYEIGSIDKFKKNYTAEELKNLGLSKIVTTASDSTFEQVVAKFDAAITRFNSAIDRLGKGEFVASNSSNTVKSKKVDIIQEAKDDLSEKLSKNTLPNRNKTKTLIIERDRLQKEYEDQYKALSELSNASLNNDDVDLAIQYEDQMQQLSDDFEKSKKSNSLYSLLDTYESKFNDKYQEDVENARVHAANIAKQQAADQKIADQQAAELEKQKAEELKKQQAAQKKEQQAKEQYSIKLNNAKSNLHTDISSDTSYSVDKAQLAEQKFFEVFSSEADKVYEYIRDVKLPNSTEKNPYDYFINHMTKQDGSVDYIKTHNEFVGTNVKLPSDVEDAASLAYAQNMEIKDMVNFIKGLDVKTGKFSYTDSNGQIKTGYQNSELIFEIAKDFLKAVASNIAAEDIHNKSVKSGQSKISQNNNEIPRIIGTKTGIMKYDSGKVVPSQKIVDVENRPVLEDAFTYEKNSELTEIMSKFISNMSELINKGIEVFWGVDPQQKNNPAVYLKDNNLNAATGLHTINTYVDKFPKLKEQSVKINNTKKDAGDFKGADNRSNVKELPVKMMVKNSTYTSKMRKTSYDSIEDESNELAETKADIKATEEELRDVTNQINEINGTNTVSNFGDLTTALKELAEAGNGSDKTTAFLKNINTLITNLTGDKASQKIEELKESVKGLATALAGFDVKDSSLLNQLDSILSRANELKSLENILKSDAKKIGEASKSQANAANLAKAQTLLADNSDKINSDFDELAKNNHFDVLTKDVTATKDGLIQIVALIKDANNEYKQLTYTTDATTKNSNGAFTFAQNGESTGFRVDKKVKAYQKWKDSTKNDTGFPNIGSVLNYTGSMAEMNFSPTDGDLRLWNELVGLMDTFGIKENDILNITRKLDGEYESFIVRMKDGTSRIVGMSSDIVLSQYQEVVTVDKDIEEFKKLNAELKKLSTNEIIDSTALQRIQEISTRLDELSDKFNVYNTQGILNDSELGDLFTLRNNTNADISTKLVDSKAIDIYTKLIDISKRYFNLIKNPNATEQQKTEIADLQTEWATNIAELQQYSGLIQALPNKTKKLTQAQEEFARVVNASYQNPLTENIGKNYNKLVTAYSRQEDKSGFSEDFENEYEQLMMDYQALQSNLSNINIFDDKDLQQVSDMNSRIVNMIESLKAYGNVAASNSSVLKLLSKINTDMHDNSAMGGQLKAQYEQLKQTILGFNGAISKSDLSDLTDQFLKLHNAMLESDQTGKSLKVRITDAIKSQTSQFIAQYVSIQDFIRYGREAVTTIESLDTALVDLKKTTTMSDAELDQFYYDSNDIAKSMGVTTEEIISQAASWSRLGYSSKEASETLAELSSQFASISPGMSTDTAQSGMVSIMQAFDIDSADAEREILDNINVVGNNFALTNSDVVAGLEKSSAALNAANNSLEQSIALIASGTEITQDAESMGTALRTNKIVRIYRNVYCKTHLIAGKTLEPCTTIMKKLHYEGITTQGLVVLQPSF